MPIYAFHCATCGSDQDQFARVDDRDANPPQCCGASMARQITAPMVSVPTAEGYKCPMSGEIVTTNRRRKYLMEANNVVDARDYSGPNGPWARRRAKDAQEKAEVKAAMDAEKAAADKVIEEAGKSAAAPEITTSEPGAVGVAAPEKVMLGEPSHTAGVPGLPHDVPYVAGRGSLDDAYESGMMAHIDHLRGVSQLEEIDFSAARELAPLGKAVDLLGDGSLWAIHTPGHSRGHVSYLVNATSGPVLLIGDASHTRWGFEHGVAPGKVTDAAASRASLERIAAFARAYPRVKLVFGHEP
jgi:putative FmdB family regulatory protein